jgi:DNA-binding response OmpR family regulator
MSESVSTKKRILVYSDDSTIRSAIAGALGTRVAQDVPDHEILEFATGKALRLFLDRKGAVANNHVDLFILDGEAVPEGGMGIARQLKDEIFQCPPVLVITARKADAWLAAWSLAEASVMHPIDPFTLAHTVADLLRGKSLTTA